MWFLVTLSDLRGHFGPAIETYLNPISWKI